ncbi:hypothetical protein GOBAR_AA24692 [Gossypium barbadense]|uniref:Uncharacterized protein n=1 Tax=Gossypium barbadense TaxID=3634 RepID=A0A2P5WY13_GOSBA|nr:hypothetical protein GOBAR_AA24692 [Gossypium barbadense]
MEDLIAGLSLDDEEDETLQLEVEEPNQEISLGHGESFCPVRVTQSQTEYVLNWDISLCAQSRRSQSWKSKWLVEDDGRKSPNFGNTMLTGERRNEGILSSNYINKGGNWGSIPKVPVFVATEDKGKSTVTLGPLKNGEQAQTNMDFDEEMVTHKEDSNPIMFSEGLKRP